MIIMTPHITIAEMLTGNQKTTTEQYPTLQQQ